MPDVERDSRAAVRAVVSAYERHAVQIQRGGYRGQWAYVATKALSDWALVDGLDLSGKRILNVGCCEPIDELFFARHPMRCWVGFDRNHSVLAAASEILHAELSDALRSRIALCGGDAACLPFLDASFDLVVSFSALEHIPDAQVRERAFAEISRVTRPGGHVAITLPNRYSLFYFCHRRHMRRGTADYGYAHLYTPREFRKSLERAGLQPVRFHSEMTGVACLPSYLPSWRLRWLLRQVGYLGERIGYLARRC